MIRLTNVRHATLGQLEEIEIPSRRLNTVIDGEGLVALPAVIDPHVHFRTPGMEYKEDWATASLAALSGGCTHVFDMPNTQPPTTSKVLLDQKRSLIDTQLRQAGLDLRYQLFFGADKHSFDQIEKVKDDIIGIKVFMGCSTGNLVIDDDESLHTVFALAAKHSLLIAVHAEDEALLRLRKAEFSPTDDYAMHSHIRSIEVACRAVEKAIALSAQYGTTLYILHVSSQEEIALIKAAKASKIPVFAETTPHHLFFDTSMYAHLGGKAVVNPPLRDSRHHDALWIAIREGIIDTIGSDHAPHTLEEKSQPYPNCPSGMPGIEFMLPMLLNAYQNQQIKLDKIIDLTSSRARKIFSLPEDRDWVLVNLDAKKRGGQHA